MSLFLAEHITRIHSKELDWNQENWLKYARTLVTCIRQVAAMTLHRNMDSPHISFSLLSSVTPGQLHYKPFLSHPLECFIHYHQIIRCSTVRVSENVAKQIQINLLHVAAVKITNISSVHSIENCIVV